MNINKIYLKAIEEHRRCNICNKILTKKDLEINNIIMTLNIAKQKNFAHKTCLIRR